MVYKNMTMNQERGLCLRSAGGLVGEANKHESHVMLHRGEHVMNCKSLMSLLAFPVCPGDRIRIECEGPDEGQALSGVVFYLTSLGAADAG
ncbi:MAG: HPr family phosphocarrier protein [Lachnospiraceae bacterium]|nr:HPr family phosphocarrier protein [Lachnospiraceae bacterium]MCD8363060.1 HPr family phosphocarrier protein [Lachnospiraceae bacterium]